MVGTGESLPAQAAQPGHEDLHHDVVGEVLGAPQVEVGAGQQVDRPLHAAAAEPPVLLQRLLAGNPA